MRGELLGAGQLDTARIVSAVMTRDETGLPARYTLPGPTGRAAPTAATAAFDGHFLRQITCRIGEELFIVRVVVEPAEVHGRFVLREDLGREAIRAYCRPPTRVGLE
jgi:hypothetical protein